MAELVQALDGWLSTGGFLPEGWRGRRLDSLALDEIAEHLDGAGWDAAETGSAVASIVRGTGRTVGDVA